MGNPLWLLLGAVYGFLGVALGAFGAHALEKTLEPRMMEIFKTATHYQLIHALALLAVGICTYILGPTAKGLTTAGWCLSAGILIFSGSLYALVFTGTRLWGAVTPIGGVLFLVGWASMAASFWRLTK